MARPDSPTATGWLLAAALCASGACSREEPPPAPQRETPPPVQPAVAAPSAQGLPPRRAVAGLAGFQSSSRVLYAAEPDKAHTLSAVFLFPARVRLCMSLAQDQATDRVLLYRAGERGFFIDQRVARSREIVGA